MRSIIISWLSLPIVFNFFIIFIFIFYVYFILIIMHIIFNFMHIIFIFIFNLCTLFLIIMQVFINSSLYLVICCVYNAFINSIINLAFREILSSMKLISLFTISPFITVRQFYLFTSISSRQSRVSRQSMYIIRRAQLSGKFKAS